MMTDKLTKTVQDLELLVEAYRRSDNQKRKVTLELAYYYRLEQLRELAPPRMFAYYEGIYTAELKNTPTGFEGI